MFTTCQATRRQTLVGTTVLLSSLFLLAPFAVAQNVTTQIPVGLSPQAVAINPVTNNTYVANTGSNTVTVIDGATGTPTFVGVGASPAAIAIDTATNKIYVADSGGVEVDVIDGATNTVTPIVVGYNPKSIAVNPVTNKIYVPNAEGDNLTVIDGATNTVSTIATGTTPRAVAINPVTNKIYVANWSSNNVTVIDGASGTTSTVAAGANPRAIAVNPVTNQIYVANYGSSNVTLINGTTNATTTIAVGAGPYAVAINSVTNKAYVSNNQGDSMTVVDGATNATTTVATHPNPGSISVNEATNQIYLINESDGTVAVLDGTSNAITQYLPAGGIATAVAVNPVTNKIYAANLSTNSFSTNNVAVIDGASNLVVTSSVSGVQSPVFNPSTNKVYFDHYDSTLGAEEFGVLDVATNTVTYVPYPGNTGGLSFYQLTLNPASNKIYATTEVPSCGLAILDGATNAVICVPITQSYYAYYNNPFLDIDSARNKVYLSDGHTVSVIDGASNATLNQVVVATVSESGYGTIPYVAVDPVTNKIYALIDVANPSGGYPLDFAAVAVIDGATDTETTIVPLVAPGPVYLSSVSMALNPVTGKVYVGSSDDYSRTGYLTAIGATNEPYTISLGEPFQVASVAVNPITNTIYVSDLGDQSTTGSVAAVNGDNFSINSIPVPAAATVVVNAATNKIYVSAYGSNGSIQIPAVAVIDGATNTFTTAALFANQVYDLAINPISDQTYITFFFDFPTNPLSVLTESQTVPNPLTTTVTPLPGNVTSSASPTFTFTATSTYAPVAAPIENVYYQLDTTQGKWLPATGTAPSFTGALSNVQLGNHILYFYATDGSDSTDLALGAASTGAISGYSFTVVTQ
jgi:YVTN family beta-propeller protein